ncbi:phytoene/squalene synthase family protein [Congregibacter litoralis]|uniref:Phytoene synthase n=1 Tax=Congregibacter litoralis KT71 TaxID=314285 RepID=A4ACR7_9GAMM|nr:phytoene/squalene synthase family protein [Congregibacter litoralis]EAQ96281.2 phytoene synthase [Congregibacter litoralis KT71]
MRTAMPEAAAEVQGILLRSRVAIPPDARSDTAHCRGMIRTGSKSFFLASHLLPSGLRGAVFALYAFCREADDAIDDGDDPMAELAIFRERLSAVYGEGVPDNTVDRALARVVHDYALPRELLEALLQGFAWDVQSRAYKDLGSVYGYGVRVAGSVGVMMALLMGVRDPGMLARAADLGVAMQLTNIARDVGEDARAGRVYLPKRWLREVGLTPQALIENPRFSPELASVVARLLSAAECLYARADSGIAGLPARCRPGIYAARKLYAGIGHELLRRGGDSVSQRTVLSSHRKFLLAAASLLPPRVNLAHLHADPLPQVRYLIRAVDELPTPEVAEGPRDGFAGDVDWVLNVFAELEKRDREVHSSGSSLRSGAAS